jgi:hypothetical protein
MAQLCVHSYLYINVALALAALGISNSLRQPVLKHAPSLFHLPVPLYKPYCKPTNLSPEQQIPTNEARPMVPVRPLSIPDLVIHTESVTAD